MFSLAPPNSSTLRSAVHQTLRRWEEPSQNFPEPLQDLVRVQIQRAALEESDPATTTRSAIHQVLLEALSALAQRTPREAQVLERHFVKGEKARAVGARLQLNRDAVNRLQALALTSLTHILLARETRARAERLLALEADLDPPQYTRLFGLAASQAALLEQLLLPTEGWVSVIVGLGGIGKTALADATARAALRSYRFERSAWIRAGAPPTAAGPHRGMDRLLALLADRVTLGLPDGPSTPERRRILSAALRKRPCLIVIDNLEEQTDTEDVVEWIGSLTGPSEFLLTSRARPTGPHPVFQLSLDELPDAQAIALLRHHAEITGQSALAQAPLSDVHAILEVVGGNPLALRLVASLVGAEPLPEILGHLKQRQSGPSQDLFTRVYARAWAALSPQAHTLLQATPLISDQGGSVAQMQAICRLEDAAFWAAVRELAARSLLEVHGSLNERRYGIHRLTESFLRAEIIQAPPPRP